MQTCCIDTRKHTLTYGYSFVVFVVDYWFLTDINPVGSKFYRREKEIGQCLEALLFYCFCTKLYNVLYFQN